MKGQGSYTILNVNGDPAVDMASVGNYTVYVSPNFVIRDNGEVTKHYYSGTQRVMSKLSGVYTDYTTYQIVGVDGHLSALSGGIHEADIEYGLDPTGPVTNLVIYNDPLIDCSSPGSCSDAKYYYHSDHLGSSAFITDGDGEPYQFISYLPFGETMVEQRQGSYDAPFKYNGKELDDLTGLYYYGARYYHPSVGNFLSIDPLTQSYPMLTPYQFASNRPIDGVDLDGLEYLTYIVNWYEGQSEPDIKISYYDEKQHNNHGWKGRGVDYVINHWKVKTNGLNELDKSKSSSFYYGRDALVAEYGLYYGSTGLFKLSKEGTFTKKYVYDLPPVDAVDFGAWVHDKSYDAVKAKGAHGLFINWATTPADKAAINYWQIILNIGEGGIDPYNSQKITEGEFKAAKNGVKGFSAIANSKANDISAWMYRFNNQIQGVVGSEAMFYGGDHQNYYIFVDTYFQKNTEGYLEKRNGYWDDNGNPIPINNENNSEKNEK